MHGDRDLVVVSLGVLLDLGCCRPLASGKTEVYGEYDQLAAEASFRINVVSPTIALSIVGASH